MAEEAAGLLWAELHAELHVEKGGRQAASLKGDSRMPSLLHRSWWCGGSLGVVEVMPPVQRLLPGVASSGLHMGCAVLQLCHACRCM